MKVFAISLLLLCVCLFSGCLGEDTAWCPPEETNNLSLRFVYPDAKGSDIFPSSIHQVHVFVFDQRQTLVSHHSVDQALLSTFAGTELHLDPGTYRIVCWGNALDKTTFAGVDTGNSFGDALLRNPTLKNHVATNGDPLYYAPSRAQAFTVTVPELGIKTETIAFCCAHIKIEVYIKGLEDRSPEGKLLPALVELTHLPAEYDFEMKNCGEDMSLRDVASFQTIDGRSLAVAEFYTPVFSEDTPMEILIQKQSDGSTLTTISVKDFIQENNIKLDHVHELIIPILVEYKSSDVSITLPGWGQKPIGPEL